MVDQRRIEAGLLGFVIGSLTVGLLVWLVSKSVSLLRGSLGSAATGGNPINIYNMPGGAGMLMPPIASTALPPSEQLADAMQLPNGTSLASRTATYALPPTRCVRVFTAPQDGPMWRVRIDVIGPAGGFGMFSIDSPLPDEINTNLNTGSQGFVLPSGRWAELRLGPRQILYAKAAGTEPDVQASIAASAEVG